MPWRFSVLFLAVLCLGTLAKKQELEREGRNSNYDFDFTNDDMPESMAGSGGAPFETDDEDLDGSGSGSGSGFGDLDIDSQESQERYPVFVKTTTTTKPTTTIPTTSTRKMSLCQKMHMQSSVMYSQYVPRCLDNGDFDSLQCHGHPGTGNCFCVDLGGREIPGTLMEAPDFPNCDEGYNLPPCIFDLVKFARNHLLGPHHLKCTVDGLFKKVQCPGSICYCVDPDTGVEIMGTRTNKPDKPMCEPVEVEITTVRVRQEEKTPVKLAPVYTDAPDLESAEDSHEDSNKETELVIPDVEEKTVPPVEEPKSNEEEPEEEGDADGHDGKEVEEAGAAQIMTQPGILAAIIGGSVVLLLCAILLVMFIVYRMKKKDEGSYPLEDKPPNYSYVRAPEREFYA